MMATGLARGEGADVHQAQVLLADRVHSVRLGSGGDWTPGELLTMLEASGPALAGHPLFEAIILELEHRAEQEPQVLVRALGRLARFALTGTHLGAACRLLAALEAAHFRPCNWQDWHDLLWSSTLLHFGCQRQAAPDQLAGSFEHFYQHSLSCTVSREGADDTAP